jgi:hypothetical protein
MHVIRRGHLYTGLFMIPWVLVYATTGFLLNLHTVWPDGGAEVRAVTPNHLAGTGLDALPTAADLAADVTAALNARGGTAQYTLVDADAAKFDWDELTVKATGGGHETHASFDPRARSGHLERKPAAGPTPAPFAADAGVFGKEKLEDRLAAGAPALFRNLNIPADKTEVPWMPELRFAVADADGATWKVKYDPKTGGVKGRRADETDPDGGAKRFLYRLHFTAGYPERTTLRTVWAVFVDLTAGLLVFWCGTGIVMWWQIKAVRVAGAVVLVASVLTAAVLGFLMYGMVQS